MTDDAKMTSASPAPLPSIYANRGLLPIGLQDQLPPDAEREAEVLEGVMTLLGNLGFDRVKPPLLEFEQTLLANAPAKLRRRSFRVVDPLSRETLVLRSDMTGQIARMAATRLAHLPRPLRLSYGGQVVRVSGSDLRPERQFTQVGAEIIGVTPQQHDNAVMETAALAIKGINQAGIQAIVLDLVLPGLVQRVCAKYNHDLSPSLQRAISARDPSMVTAHSCGECAQVLARMMAAAGPWQECLGKLTAIDGLLAADQADQIARLAQRLGAQNPGVEITLDPAEMRGFEYHDRIGFVLFAPAVRGELGRGGAYVADNGEAGVGFTLYLDSLVRALGPQAAPSYVFVPQAHLADLDALMAAGHRVRRQLDMAVEGNNGQPPASLAQQAKQMGCAAIWDGASVVPLS